MDTAACPDVTVCVFVQFIRCFMCIHIAYLPRWTACSSSASPARQECVFRHIGAFFAFEATGQRTCLDLCCVHVYSDTSNQIILGVSAGAASAAPFKSDFNLNVLLIPT